MRSLIPIKQIDSWKDLMEERARSVVTALLPRVRSNLTIRNLSATSSTGADGDDEGKEGEGGDAQGHSTFAENFNNEVAGTWGQHYINKAFADNGIVLISFTPSEVHLTDANTKLRLEESARDATLQEMEIMTIQKAFEAKAQKLRTDMELQAMQVSNAVVAPDQPLRHPASALRALAAHPVTQ